jgi:hypothetical protein
MPKIKTKWVKIPVETTSSHWMNKVEDAQSDVYSEAYAKAWEKYFCSR